MLTTAAGLAGMFLLALASIALGANMARQERGS
jgi:hypothetical protein